MEPTSHHPASFAFADQGDTVLGYTRHGSRACMLADTLAWAVARDVPLDDALVSLPFFLGMPVPSWRVRRHFTLLKWALWPFRCVMWWVTLRWSWYLGAFMKDLESGQTLHRSLTLSMSRQFPRFYLQGVARAEAEGRLETALPILARQLRFPSTVFGERKASLLLGGWRLLMTLWVILFMTSAVVPKFDAIFEDLLGRSHPALSVYFGTSGEVLAWIIAGAIGVFLYSKLPVIGEYILFLIPGVGRERKRLVLSELASSMAVFLRQGGDVLSAAEWSMETTRSTWLRGRLRRFIAAMKAGTSWADAWSQMDLPPGLDAWIVKQAATREDPAGGFELMAEWLYQEIHLVTRRINRWFEPCCTLVFAVVVGLMAWQVFALLTDLITSMAEG